MKIGIISEFSPRTCDYSSLKSLKQKNLEIHLFREFYNQVSHLLKVAK